MFFHSGGQGRKKHSLKYPELRILVFDAGAPTSWALRPRQFKSVIIEYCTDKLTGKLARMAALSPISHAFVEIAFDKS